MPQDGLDLDNPSVSPEQVQAELETVLRSATFERSERLQRFLRYICELTLKGEGHRINEYLIGSEVFRKGADYNPNEDSIVRRQAHTLRQKLQDFYSGEGRDHAVRIELPVGRYVPVFRRQETLKAEPGIEELAPAVTTPPTPAVPARSYHSWPVLAAVLMFLAGAIVAWTLLPHNVAAPVKAIPPAAREIWAPWLQDTHEAVICFSNPMTAVIKHFDQPLPPNAQPPRFKTSPAEDALFRRAFRLPPGGVIYLTPVINQAKMGEAIAGVTIASFLGHAGLAVSTTQSRFLSWEDLRKQNLILLGHDEANPWVDPLLRKYPFHLTPTSGRQQRSILNTAPRPGEQSNYQIAYSGEDREADQEYALISMLPGFEGDHQLLLVNGLNTQATQIATEFLTRGDTLTELVKRMRSEAPGHRGAWRFQAVVKTEVYDKVPTRATLVTVRVVE
jgi:hypothetical protein